ncbi:hypothetical protein D3C80_1984750 [compost metagenome]
MAYQQFAINRAFEIHGLQHIGKSAGNVVASARIKPSYTIFCNGLNTNTVPFPFGTIG